MNKRITARAIAAKKIQSKTLSHCIAGNFRNDGSISNPPVLGIKSENGAEGEGFHASLGENAASPSVSFAEKASGDPSLHLGGNQSTLAAPCWHASPPVTPSGQGKPSEPLIRFFMSQFCENAEALGHEGKIIIMSYGQDPATGIPLATQFKHFSVPAFNKDLVSEMTDYAVEQNSQKHRNVSIAHSIFRPDLRNGTRGEAKDIIALVGIIAEFGDEDAAYYVDRLPKRPDYTLQPSPGRFLCVYQYPFPFFIPALTGSVREFRKATSRLHKTSGCSFSVTDLAHMWPIGGTLLWPDKQKIEMGWPEAPQYVKVVRSTETLGDLCFWLKLDSVQGEL